MLGIAGRKIFVGKDILPVEDLKEHETISPVRFSELMYDIVSRGSLDKPIVVDFSSKTIIDGHHRYNVFRALGMDAIPVIYVDYFHPSIIVESRSNVTKEDVIRASLTGVKFSPKTTCHMLSTETGTVHISSHVKDINYPVFVRELPVIE